jgi:hypothetical protein
MKLHPKQIELQVEQLLITLTAIEEFDPYSLTNHTISDLEQAELVLKRLNRKIRGCRDGE